MYVYVLFTIQHCVTVKNGLLQQACNTEKFIFDGVTPIVLTMPMFGGVSVEENGVLSAALAWYSCSSIFYCSSSSSMILPLFSSL